MDVRNILQSETVDLADRMITILADELDPAGSLSTDDYKKFQKKYFDDLEGFARDCIIWEADEELTFYQAEGMRKFVKHKRFSMRGPHGLGKTMFASITVLWFALTRDGYDWKLMTLASAFRQLTKYLWPEVHKWARKIRWDIIGRKPFTKNELLQETLKLSTGSAFAIASDNAALIEGAHARYMLYLFDESKIIPDDTWDAAEGAFSTGDCMWLAISTPGEPSGRFYEIHSHKEGYEDWATLFVTLKMAISAQRINPDWAKQRAKQWGIASTVYKNRVLGEFASSDDEGVIILADLERSNQRWLERKDKGEFKYLTGLGIDVGRGGDPSVIAHEYDNNAILLIETTDTRNSMEIAGRAVGLLKKWLDAKAVFDLGYDPGVYDRAREDERVRDRCIPFVGASKIDMTDETGELGFVNLRAAAYWNMRELLKNDLYDLPPDDILTGDLTAPHYQIKSGGRIQVQGKGDTMTFGKGIRHTLKRSTDRGDAVTQVAMKANIETGNDDLSDLGHLEDFKNKWS